MVTYVKVGGWVRLKLSIFWKHNFQEIESK